MRQIFEYHPSIAYRFIPGLQVRIPHESGGYLVKTNGTGFRCGHEFVAAKTPGKRRVLLFGDSFTAGDGVSNGKRFGDYLESLIPDLEVFNFGMPGTGTDQHYLIWREWGKGIEADAVIISALVENIRRVNSKSRPFKNDQGEEAVYAKPYFELVDGKPVLHGVPVQRDPLTPEQLAATDAGVARTGRFTILRKAVNKLGLRDIAQKVTGYQPLPEYDSPDSPDWLLMRAILMDWIPQIPAPVLLLPFPLSQYIEETSSAENVIARFAEVAKNAGCRMHDVLPDLWKYPMDERRTFRFPVDVHPTPKGHEAVAKSLAPAVEAMLGQRTPA
jgi:carbamoyltransferase